MTMRLWVKSSIIAVAAALMLAVPASADIGAVSGSAFGLQATGVANVSAAPSVTLPATGSGNVPITNTAASGSVPGFLSTGLINVSTNGALGPAGFATSGSDIVNLNLGIAGLSLTADVVTSHCDSTSSGSTGSTVLANAVINGIALSSTPAANTVVPVLGVATIIVNEQTATGGLGSSSITVNAFHVQIGPAGAPTEDIIISQSHCDVTTPSAVKLQTFVAAPANKGVALRWRTASEVQTLGFNVYRQQGTKLVKVNATLIAARGSAGGHSYTLVDRHAPRTPVVRYRLQEVQLNGSRIWLARTSLAG